MGMESIIQIGFWGGTSQTLDAPFTIRKVRRPIAKQNDLLIEIKAIAINPVDQKLREQKSMQPLFHVVGYDAVGVIVEMGSKVTEFSVGDRVYYSGTSTRQGCQQSLQLVNADLVAYAPTNLTDAEAASIPLAGITAYELLIEKFGCIPMKSANIGKTILVVNGAGGVGSLFTQLAHWLGLRVVATASKKNFSWLQRNKVDIAIDYHQSLRQQLSNHSIDYVQYIACLHQPDLYFDEFSACIAPFGHIGLIVATEHPIELAPFKNLSVSIDWEYMFAKSEQNIKMDTQGKILGELTKLIESNSIHPTVGYTFEGIHPQTLTEAVSVWKSNAYTGKIVLTGPVTTD